MMIDFLSFFTTRIGRKFAFKPSRLKLIATVRCEIFLQLFDSHWSTARFYAPPCIKF